MHPVTLLILIGMLLTVIALGFGIRSMTHGGEYDQKHSGQFMMYRVSAQGATLLVLLLALIAANA